MYARNFNSELEKLREEVSVEPLNLKTTVLNINQKASQIHAAYLFENEGKELLQKLCLLLSATASGKSYGDWQKFAALLGLVNEQIKCIDYNFKGLQDPTYYVLLTFAQSTDATMDQIFLALEQIDRLDIIKRLFNCFNEFFYNLLQKKNSDFKNGMYKPISLPRAPLVLSLLVQNQQETNQVHLRTPGTIVSNYTNTTQNQKYGSIIMLTFAEDGSKTVERIAKIFRSQEPKIGVVILQEQEKHVYSRAEEFIDDCFKQVNYIVPILTEGYLLKINQTLNDDTDNNLDSKYLRYIYSLLRYEYVKDNCMNNRVRCIVPDNEMKKILPLVLHPTLQAWFKESDINLFTERILLRKF